MNRVAIFGIGGLYNFGCEAIVRGTVEFVRRLYGKDTIITYYTREFEQDKITIEDLGIEIKEIKYKSSFFKKAISKVIDIFQIPIVPFFNDIFALIIDNSDVIVSVGGDIYTIPRYLRDHKKYRYVNYMVEFGKKAIKNNKKVIIYGASVGPFGQYSKAKKYYIDHLKEVDRIICREMKSISYLKSEGVVNNVLFLPDPAFLVKENDSKIIGNYIGINLSELSLQEVYGKVTTDMINDICIALENVVIRTGYPLMLIPHVLSPYTTEDNDLVFLKKIYQRLPEDIKRKTMLAEPKNFIDAKQYLRKCKIVVAARMHCAVNSIIEGIPSIFLSYSQKSIGMSEFVYGNTKYTLDIKDMTRQLGDSVVKLLEEYEQARELVNKRNLEISNYYDEYFRNDKQALE